MIEMVCAVVFSVGIIRDMPREQLNNEYANIARPFPTPYVVFPCLMSDMEAYRFYSQHDPQINGDYDPARGCPCGQEER